MMLVRHGFMIVGGHLGGKTMAYRVLAGALEDLEMAGVPDQFKVSLGNLKKFTHSVAYEKFMHFIFADSFVFCLHFL